MGKADERTIGIQVDEIQGGYYLYMQFGWFGQDWQLLKRLPLAERVLLFEIGLGRGNHSTAMTKTGMIDFEDLSGKYEREVTSVSLQDLGKLEPAYELLFADCCDLPSKDQMDTLWDSPDHTPFSDDMCARVRVFLDVCGGTIFYWYNDGREVHLFTTIKSYVEGLVRHNIEYVLQDVGSGGTHMNRESLQLLMDVAGDYIQIHSRDLTLTESGVQFTCWRPLRSKDKQSLACEATLENGELGLSEWTPRSAPSYLRGYTSYGLCLVWLLVLGGMGYGIYKLFQFLF